MSDGAHLGAGAEQAMKGILGNKEALQETNEGEGMTPEEMEAMIRSASIRHEGFDYDGDATAMARIIMEAFDKYPELINAPHEAVYLRDDDGNMVWKKDRGVVVSPGLSDALKVLHPDKRSPERRVMHEQTGFMWGWAVNAVRYAMKLGPVSNPALWTVKAKEDDA